MIDLARLRPILGFSGLLLAVAVLCSVALDRSLRLAGGLVLGALLGAAPFLSWGFILSRGFSERRHRVLAALLGVGKLALYAGLLYYFVTRSLASPLGVMIGMTGEIGIILVGSLLGVPGRPREVV
jgi:hypothetical protein